EGGAPDDFLFGDIHGFESDAEAIVVTEEMAGDDVRYAKLVSGGGGVAIFPRESLRHAKRANAEGWGVAEGGDHFVRESGAEVFEFGVVRGVLEGEHGDSGRVRQAGSRWRGTFAKEKSGCDGGGHQEQSGDYRNGETHAATVGCFARRDFGHAGFDVALQAK